MIFILAFYLFITLLTFGFSILYYFFKSLVDKEPERAAIGLRIALRSPIWPILLIRLLKDTFGPGHRLV